VSRKKPKEDPNTEEPKKSKSKKRSKKDQEDEEDENMEADNDKQEKEAGAKPASKKQKLWKKDERTAFLQRQYRTVALATASQRSREPTKDDEKRNPFSNLTPDQLAIIKDWCTMEVHYNDYSEIRKNNKSIVDPLLKHPIPATDDEKLQCPEFINWMKFRYYVLGPFLGDPHHTNIQHVAPHEI